MSVVVWKHSLPAVVNNLDLAVGAKVLHFDEQPAVAAGLFLWEAHGTDVRPTETRTFQVVGTGDAADVDTGRHVGSVVTRIGLVFHLFETTDGAA